MWILWILLANAGIMWLEYVYQTATYSSFLTALPYIVVPILVGQVGLFYGFRSAPNLFFAGAVFTLVNVGLRIINTYIIGESLNWYNIAGVGCLVLSTILLKVK